MWESLPIIHPEPVNCPVCKAVLAHRNACDRLWARCEECKTNFYFPPFSTLPNRVEVDSITLKKSKKCGCGRCSG